MINELKLVVGNRREKGSEIENLLNSMRSTDPVIELQAMPPHKHSSTAESQVAFPNRGVIGSPTTKDQVMLHFLTEFLPHPTQVVSPPVLK